MCRSSNPRLRRLQKAEIARQSPIGPDLLPDDPGGVNRGTEKAQEFGSAEQEFGIARIQRHCGIIWRRRFCPPPTSVREQFSCRRAIAGGRSHGRGLFSGLLRLLGWRAAA
jgi:hypothetical protein